MVRNRDIDRETGIEMRDRSRDGRRREMGERQSETGLGDRDAEQRNGDIDTEVKRWRETGDMGIIEINLDRHIVQHICRMDRGRNRKKSEIEAERLRD